jgi:sulfur carrier protein|tara:strand:+ start:468 stop:674 length:207 start_codon:yes stop_codon:yes gene_type:complete
MIISVNGTQQTIPKEATLENIVKLFTETPIPNGVAVALNYAVITKANWKSTQVEENDEVEILWASAGG